MEFYTIIKKKYYGPDLRLTHQIYLNIRNKIIYAAVLIKFPLMAV